MTIRAVVIAAVVTVAVVTAAVVTADIVVTAAVVTAAVVTADIIVTAAVVTAAVDGGTTAVARFDAPAAFIVIVCAAVATAGAIVTCAAIYYATVVVNVDIAVVTFAAIDKAEVIVTFSTTSAILAGFDGTDATAVAVAATVVVFFHWRPLWQLLLHYFCILYPIHAGCSLSDLNSRIFRCAFSLRNCLQQPWHPVLAVRRRLISLASCHRRIMSPMD